MFAGHPGHLHIWPRMAKTHEMGEKKLFVKINFNGEEWKNDHKKGHEVFWEDDHHFAHHVHEAGLDKEICFELMDHDGMLSNHLIGHCNVPVRKFCHGEEKEWDEEVHVEKDGQNHGKIVFHMRFKH